MRRVRLSIIAPGKAISIVYPECVSVFLPWLSVLQNACGVLYCYPMPLRLYHIYTPYLINDMIFEKKKNVWTQDVCFDFLYNNCLKYFSF